MDRALEILKNHNSFTTERERQQRDILIAAIDNLVDFAAAEEYSMLGELPETADEQDMEAHEKICRRYNLVHAEEENNQAMNGYVPGIFHWKGFPSANPSFLRN